MENIWRAVDEYFCEKLLGTDPVLDRLLENNAAAGLPPYDVSPAQGKLLHLLARMQEARNILEVGTLGGYGSVWLARALADDGHLITLEIDPGHAEVARRNLDMAGLAEKVQVMTGDALDSLAQIYANGHPPFDLVFIDADKERNAEYFSWAMELVRNGGLVIVDNVVRGGAVIEQNSDDPKVLGVRALIDLIESEHSVKATVVQTAGSKGYDGLVLAIVDNEAIGGQQS